MNCLFFFVLVRRFIVNIGTNRLFGKSKSINRILRVQRMKNQHLKIVNLKSKHLEHALTKYASKSNKKFA